MLNLRNVTIRLGGNKVIDAATAAIPTGARVGFVGRNGAGKSTLMKAIIGALDPDSGTIETPSDARLGYLRQEAPSGPMPVIDKVLEADAERDALLSEAGTATDPDRLGHIYDRLEAIDAYGAPARAARILKGLGFDEAVQDQPLDSFSGGWRTRVMLASLLFTRPDILLLDEPSNHLDLEAVLWLEGFLRGYDGTVLLISHERDLLNNVADHILHLHQGKTTLYRGGYDAFERQRLERQAQQASATARLQAERDKLQAFVDRWRYKATKAKQAQSRIKALTRMQPIAEVVDDPSLTLRFSDPDGLKAPLLVVEKAAVGYEAGVPILSRVSLRLDPQDRIALLGRNGNGKSTLARLIAGTLDLMEGQRTAAPKLRVGFFTQYHVEELNPLDTPLNHMTRGMPHAAPSAVRAYLGRFGFSGSKASTQTGKLSGGERARLALALVTQSAPHLLILDEPTNHLDIDTRQALIEALNGYGGAVIVVSHDRHLVELVADRLFLVEGGGVKEFDGTLDDYAAWVVSGAERGRGTGGTKADRTARKTGAIAADTGASKALRSKVSEAEAENQRLQQALAELDAALSGIASPSLAGLDMGELLKRRAETARLLDAVEARWMAAVEQLETLDRGAAGHASGAAE